MATYNQVEFDFDKIDINDVEDSARQVIIKKRHYPIDFVGLIIKAERVNFNKDRSDDRLEIVVDVRFVFDLLNAKSIRMIENEEIDYKESSVRLHLPKRYQEQFKGLDNLNLLVGGLVLCPNHDKEKWSNKRNCRYL